jgi:uncharacterized protein (DUF362 family)
VVRQIRRHRGVPLVGDNPSLAKPRTALHSSGILALLEQEEVEVPDLGSVVRPETPYGKSFRSFEVSTVVSLSLCESRFLG